MTDSNTDTDGPQTSFPVTEHGEPVLPWHYVRRAMEARRMANDTIALRDGVSVQQQTNGYEDPELGNAIAELTAYEAGMVASAKRAPFTTTVSVDGIVTAYDVRDYHDRLDDTGPRSRAAPPRRLIIWYAGYVFQYALGENTSTPQVYALAAYNTNTGQEVSPRGTGTPTAGALLHAGNEYLAKYEDLHEESHDFGEFQASDLSYEHTQN